MPKTIKSVQQSSDCPTIVKKVSRKLTEADCEAVARLITEKRLTQTEACIHLGIKPRQFVNWLYIHKNSHKFNDCLSRMRSARINTLVSTIEDAGTGRNGYPRQDWRASAWLLQFGLSDSPFQPNQTSTTNQLIVGDNRVLADIISRVYEPPQSQIATAPATVALPSPPADVSTG